MCAGARAWLHLVRPLSFQLEDRYLKRAGLDYWPSVRLSVHDDLSSLERMLPGARTLLFTKRADPILWDRSYVRGEVLVFGAETTGLPRPFLERWKERTVRIPTSSDVRSLNLSNSVAIATYEGLRQFGWAGENPMGS